MNRGVPTPFLVSSLLIKESVAQKLFIVQIDNRKIVMTEKEILWYLLVRLVRKQ